MDTLKEFKCLQGKFYQGQSKYLIRIRAYGDRTKKRELEQPSEMNHVIFTGNTPNMLDHQIPEGGYIIFHLEGCRISG